MLIYELLRVAVLRLDVAVDRECEQRNVRRVRVLTRLLRVPTQRVEQCNPAQCRATHPLYVRRPYGDSQVLDLGDRPAAFNIDTTVNARSGELDLVESELMHHVPRCQLLSVAPVGDTHLPTMSARAEAILTLTRLTHARSRCHRSVDCPPVSYTH